MSELTRQEAEKLVMAILAVLELASGGRLG
jgi:hypothetical protein